MFRRVQTSLVIAGFIGACFLATQISSATSNTKSVTFNKDIAPILFAKCVSCHRTGEIAPMSLMTYQEARPWAKSIREKVVSKQMPPWSADPKYGQWANDPRLSQQELDTIVSWVEAGAPKGEDKDLPAPPKFADGWTIGKPDV